MTLTFLASYQQSPAITFIRRSPFFHQFICDVQRRSSRFWRRRRFARSTRPIFSEDMQDCGLDQIVFTRRSPAVECPGPCPYGQTPRSLLYDYGTLCGGNSTNHFLFEVSTELRIIPNVKVANIVMNVYANWKM